MATELQMACWACVQVELLAAAEKMYPDRFAPVGEDWQVVCREMHRLGLLAIAPPGEAYVIAQGGREWLEDYRRAKAKTSHTAQNAALAVH